jgi:hypothetical protein
LRKGVKKGLLREEVRKRVRVFSSKEAKKKKWVKVKVRVKE